MAVGPTRDVKEFQFKISGQVRVFPPGEKLNLETPVKLVATSSKYGLVFVGSPKGLICIQTKDVLYNPEIQSKPLTVLSEFPRRCFPLPSQPSHVDVSADNELLAVVVFIRNVPVLQVFSVASFGSLNIVKKVEMRLSNSPGIKVVDLQWNPGFPSIIIAVMSDSSVSLFEIKDSSFTLNTLPPTCRAKCLCWSPKGKQVVIGSADGSLSQYKPDLKLVKTFPPPYPSASVTSVHWPSSFQFIAAYANTANNDRPAIAVVNVPKGGTVSYVRYEDVCFTSLSKRPEYYFIHQQTWNVIVIGCGDSMELSVLGLEPNTVNWIHWKQEDSTRAELPLTDDKDDVHNLGIALDTSPSQPIQLNDSLSVGPMPIVMSLSHDGVLCLFTALNLTPGAPPICSHPQPFPEPSGLHLFASQVIQKVPAMVQPAVQPTAVSAAGPVPSFSPGKMFSLGSVPAVQPNQVPQTSTPFFQTTSSFGFSSSFGGQPSFSSAFSASTQPSPFPTTSPFSSQPPLLSAPVSTVFSSTTSSPAPPAVSQPALPVNLNTQSAPPDVQPQPLIPATPNLTPKPLLPPTPSIPSFGLDQSATLPATKPAENTFLSKPEFTTPGFLGVDLPQPQEEPPKPELKLVEVKTVALVNHPPPPEKPQQKVVEEKIDTTEIDNAAYMAAVYDELKSFQEEYTGVKQYLKTFKVKVGEEKVKGELCGKMDSYEEFSTELIETTQAQCAEVSSLRMSLLEILSWIQLVKTKQNINKNPRLIEMREAEEMDPVGKYWCKRIEQSLYCLQSQVKQAVQQIESIKKSNSGGGLNLPTFEVVLQTLINQSKIVNTQKGVISNLEEQLSHKVKRFEQRRKKIIQSNSSSRNKIVDDSQLSQLAEKLLQTKLEASEDTTSYSYRESSQRMLNKGVDDSNRIDPLKEQSLKEWLKNHQIVRTKVKPRPKTISELNSPLKTSIKLIEKKPVSFAKEQVESSQSLVIKPVPTTPLGRTDSKTGQLSRNLFAVGSENSGITSLTPIRPNMKTMFQKSVTSTPLPIAKKDQPQSVILPSLSASPPNPAETSDVSPLLLSSKTTPLSFGSASTPSPQPLETVSTKITPPVKTTEAQAKSVEQANKVAGFGSLQNFPAFTVGNINKEVMSSESQVPPTTSTSSLFAKPAITKSSSQLFGGLSQSDSKATTEDSGNSLSFNFELLASSVKGSLQSDKPSVSPKVETSVASSLIQPFSFGGLSISTTSAAATTVAATTASAPLFSFNLGATSASTSSPQTTTNNVIKPMTSFSYGGVSTSVKSTVAPTATSTVQSSSFSFGAPVPVSADKEQSVAAVPTPSAASIAPVTSVTPSITSVNITTVQSPLITTVSVPSLVTSTPSPKPPATSTFSAPASAAPQGSTVATTASTTTTSVFTSPQVSQDSPSFKPPSTSAPAFGSSAFGSFTPTTSTTNLFGSAAMKFTTATTSAAPAFGVPVSTAVSSAPLFSQAATTTASPFGQTITSTQAPASPFSQSSPTQSTTISSPFGQPAATTTTSSFGSSAFGSSSVFSSLPNSTFGGVSTFGAATTAQSVFGSPATTTTASSLFSTPLFGQTTASAASPFGAAAGQTSPFSSTSPSTQAPTSPFGGASSPQANPFFSQTPQPSVFAAAASQGNFGSSGGSIFGGSSSFGSTPQGSQFQSPGGNIFGGSGPFSSGGGQTVSQAGFGAPPSFQSPKPTTGEFAGGFGSGPVFGSSPSFGGAPTFGAPSSFGSPNKVFGSTSPVSPGPPAGGGGGFGGQANMFESLANQNTMSFGNLAQNQQPQPLAPPSFGSPQQSQPPNPSFGGNAFSSWR